MQKLIHKFGGNYNLSRLAFVSFILIILAGIHFFLQNQTKPVLETSKSEVKTMPHSMKKLLKERKKISNTNPIQAPILMYHYIEYVSDKKDTIRQSLNINPNVFEEQIKTLKNAGYTFLTAGELSDIFYEKKQSPKKPLLLTFDDGHNDLEEFILPILKKYNVKATAYIITDFLDRFDFLSTQQLKNVIKSGLVEIGAHTVHHVSLSEKLPFVVKNEVEESKKFLEENFKLKIVSFAYPNGAFDEQAIQIVKKAGFKTAVSTVFGTKQSEKNRFFLYRVRPGYMTGEVLLNYLEKERLEK